jgi:tetratricopeptide (TPR) repeat protein
MTTTFGEYLTMYRKSWLRLQQTTPGLLSYEDRALFSTWNISYAQIKRQNMRSAMLLRLWTYFDNEDVWFELLQEGHASGPQWFRELTSDALGFSEAVRVLCDYGLVEADAAKESGRESGGYSMHSCVHMWTVHVLNGSWDVGMARLAMRCVGSHVPLATQRDYWVVQRRLAQHAGRWLALVMAGTTVADGDGWILHNLGLLYASQGRLSDAEAMYMRALQGYEKALGADHTSTLNTVNNLGLLYADQGRLSDAEAMYMRALQGYEKALGPEQTNSYIPALHTIQNFATLFARLGNTSEAKALYLRCQEGLKTVFGADHERYQQVTQALVSLR